MEQNGVLARLEAIDQRLARIEAKQDRHDAQHQALAEASERRRLETEQRLTRLESAVQTRSAFGVLGLAVSYLLQLLGWPKPAQ